MLQKWRTTGGEGRGQGEEVVMVGRVVSWLGHAREPQAMGLETLE